MTGIYVTDRGMYNARIQVRDKLVHLGSFPTSGQAARAYDTACFVLGRPLSKYNNPDLQIDAAHVHKTVSMLHTKGALAGTITELKDRYDDIRDYALYILAEGVQKDDS